jgi:hypothetical protein
VGNAVFACHIFVLPCRLHNCSLVEFVGPILAAMQQMIDYLLAWAGHYSQQVMQWNLMDEYLFDIPLIQYLYRREYHSQLHLRLGDLPDDRTAIKMTGFNIVQLRRLYGHLGLQHFVLAHFETDLLIGTNNFYPVIGAKKCYHINPEELFLYLLTRLKIGMSQEMIVDHYFGGDYNCWSYGHRRMMLYLNRHYVSILGHEGIFRYLPFVWRILGCDQGILPGGLSVYRSSGQSNFRLWPEQVTLQHFWFY